MNYFKNTLTYIFKNFWYIFLLSIVPTVFIGILLNPFKLFEFINLYPSMPVQNFGSIFYGLIDFNFLSIFLSLLALIILSIFVSVIIGFMENHMRSGKLSFKGIKNYVNNNILVVLCNLFVLYIINFVLKFVLSTVIFLSHLIFTGLGSTPGVFTFILAILFSLVEFFMILFALSTVLINIPNMLLNGYPFKQGIANSVKLVNKSMFKLALQVFLPFLVIIPLVSLFAGNGWIMLINVLGVLILIMYYTALSMTTYFEVSNTNRYDNRKYYYTYK